MSKITKKTPPQKFKIWRGLLTQTGTNAPTAVEIENSLGGVIVWSRVSAGFYYGTLNGAFPATKIADKTGILDTFTGSNFRVFRDTDNRVGVFTRASIGSANADALLSNTYIEILVQI